MAISKRANKSYLATTCATVSLRRIVVFFFQSALKCYMLLMAQEAKATTKVRGWFLSEEDWIHHTGKDTLQDRARSAVFESTGALAAAEEENMVRLISVRHQNGTAPRFRVWRINF